jgi:hypothetical protein
MCSPEDWVAQASCSRLTRQDQDKIDMEGGRSQGGLVGLPAAAPFVRGEAILGG